ncbi:MAG: 50S ribosomal protein L29 [Alphaproteobacteria bacterium]|nr:50S ribosomal protein L29 [Alphaproteobacteria bacterium]
METIAMKYAELKQKTVSELYDLYSNLKREQLNLRLTRENSENKDTSRQKKIRRDVARIQTLLNETKKKAQA